MPTDDERREVAERLRHSWTNVPDKNPVRHQLRVLFEIYSAVGLADDDDADAIDLFDRLADLIEPAQDHFVDPGEKVDRDALLELADEEGGCDFTQSVTEGEPPYNLYSLYEVVFRRHPRDKYAIDDDEVDDLVDALLEICNAPGHEIIQRPQSSEQKVRCVAEVKVDGEQLDQLVNDAVVEVTGIDRDALLALADECENGSKFGRTYKWSDPTCASIATMLADEYGKIARRIRKALGATDG